MPAVAEALAARGRRRRRDVARVVCGARAGELHEPPHRRGDREGDRRRRGACRSFAVPSLALIVAGNDAPGRTLSRGARRDARRGVRRRLRADGGGRDRAIAPVRARRRAAQVARAAAALGARAVGPAEAEPLWPQARGVALLGGLLDGAAPVDLADLGAARTGGSPRRRCAGSASTAARCPAREMSAGRRVRAGRRARPRRRSLAIERASFSDPWSRGALRRGARPRRRRASRSRQSPTGDVAGYVVGLVRRATRGRSRIWRWRRRTGAQDSARALLRRGARGGARCGGCADAPPGGARVERRRARAVRALRLRGGRAAARRTTGEPVEDALVLAARRRRDVRRAARGAAAG